MERLMVPKPVDRIGYIKSLCHQKKILDLGAMDETAYQKKRGRGTWLHEEIAKSAAQVVGLDSSSVIPSEGLSVSENAVIYRGDIFRLESWLESQSFSPDIIVAGELIEHLENPLSFLRSLSTIASLRGKPLVLTTPNATAAHNFLISLLSRESTHHDHLTILSFKTLCTLCMRAGFQDWSIVPYFSRFTEMKFRSRGLRRRLVATGELVINGFEWMFPMTSFGYLVRVSI
jgi:Methyltransferase domain